LRTGVIPKSNKVFLDEIKIDEEGTGQQTKGQRDSGKYHILANVWLSEFGEDRLPGLWRLVTVEPDQDHLDPPIITLLPPDGSTARSEANLTDFLKKERQKNDKPWLTTEYIAATLHPLLRDGHLRNQNDLSNHLNAVAMRPVIEAKEKQTEHERRGRQVAEQKTEEERRARLATERKNEEERLARQAAEQKTEEANSRFAEEKEKNKLLADENEAMAKALADIRERFNSEPTDGPSVEPARAVTRPWPSKDSKRGYMNIGVEASVVDVHPKDPNIFLEYIDRNGQVQTVKDFGLHGFRKPIYDYLQSCKDQGRRAVFILTYLQDKKMRLAADTMMLPTYVHLWRNK
jgi:hypothetical protein